jgi:hypothetical protein
MMDINMKNKILKMHNDISIYFDEYIELPIFEICFYKNDGDFETILNRLEEIGYVRNDIVIDSELEKK